MGTAPESALDLDPAVRLGSDAVGQRRDHHVGGVLVRADLSRWVGDDGVVFGEKVQGAVCRSAGDAAGKGADVGFKDRCVGAEPPE